MAKLIVSEFLTLDACMEDPGGAEKSPFGGWSLDYGSEAYYRYKLEETLAADVLLLGRRTYEGFAAAWPDMKDPEGFADKMNSMRKVVVTGTLQTLAWNNSTILTGDLAAGVRRLKEAPGGDILLAGSQNLASFLLDEGLVDQLSFLIHPVMVGGGLRFFEGLSKRLGLELLESRRLDKGVLLAVYRPLKE